MSGFNTLFAEIEGVSDINVFFEKYRGVQSIFDRKREAAGLKLDVIIEQFIAEFPAFEEFNEDKISEMEAKVAELAAKIPEDFKPVKGLEDWALFVQHGFSVSGDELDINIPGEIPKEAVAILAEAGLDLNGLIVAIGQGNKHRFMGEVATLLQNPMVVAAIKRINKAAVFALLLSEKAAKLYK